MLKQLLNGAIALTLASLPLSVNAKPIDFGGRDYARHTKGDVNNSGTNYGAASTQVACLGSLQSNGANYAFTKTMWLNFLVNNQKAEWLEADARNL